ncbi:adenylate kinase family protein [Methanoregula sp.]|uniref:adenylate kinase family protein n=1 Tax=Methanoregula sp. TaxID=2052170 RepID=UPI002C905FF6|nr:adenylate kinase family protein [Methanoregula sp.]HVP96988.1 adenylate kinase family protein [Methanoregula sp.]
MMYGITGTPGTGKSTIADELARRGHKVVHITEITPPYVLGKDPERDTQIINTDRMADEFVPFDGFVEGHFAHLLPCDRVVVLRLRPDLLADRLAARGYPAEKVRENRDAEALDVCLIETVEHYGPSEVFELDTTGLDPGACADAIERFYRGEVPASFGSIDWSSYAEVLP